MMNTQNKCWISLSHQDVPILMKKQIAQSAGAVEYTDYFSAEG